MPAGQDVPRVPRHSTTGRASPIRPWSRIFGNPSNCPLPPAAQDQRRTGSAPLPPPKRTLGSCRGLGVCTCVRVCVCVCVFRGPFQAALRLPPRWHGLRQPLQRTEERRENDKKKTQTIDTKPPSKRQLPSPLFSLLALHLRFPPPIRATTSFHAVSPLPASSLARAHSRGGARRR